MVNDEATAGKSVGAATHAARPLRILSILHSLEPGGVERDILRLTTAWRAAGLDARIVLGRREGLLSNELPDVPVFRLQQGDRSTARIETLWMIAKLPGVIEQFCPDVLFFASNNMLPVAAAMRLIMGRRCPALVLRVSNDLGRSDLPVIARRLHRAGLRIHPKIYDAIIAMAEPVRAEIIEHMRADPDQVVVINNASLTTETAHRLAKSRDARMRDHLGRRFLAVGRLMPQKNFALLIAAFAHIARPDDRLRIVGEGPLRQALEEAAESLGVKSQVDFAGYRFDPASWYAYADAFILSSDFEGLGNVVIEALAAGIPIVATRCGVALPMLVADAGLIVPIQDVGALAAAMDAICAIPVDVDVMRARAAAFTTEATVGEWRDFFKTVTHQSRL